MSTGVKTNIINTGVTGFAISDKIKNSIHIRTLKEQRKNIFALFFKL